MTDKKGQSTLEYILLVSAVLIVIIAIVAKPDSTFKQVVNSALNDGANQVNLMTSKVMDGK